MAATQHNVDPFTTNDKDISQPMLKIIHKNLRLILSLDVYPNELQLLVQILNNSGLSFAFYGTFSSPIQWLSLVSSMVLYNNKTIVVNFQITLSKTKKLIKKQFAQILNLPSLGNIYEFSTDQVIHMFNEIGHQHTLVNISSFKKSSLPYIWSFLFGIVLRCLTGRSSGIDKAKLKVYSVMARMYYGLNVDYASLLWEELGTYISHSKLVNRVSSAKF